MTDAINTIPSAAQSEYAKPSEKKPMDSNVEGTRV